MKRYALEIAVIAIALTVIAGVLFAATRESAAAPGEALSQVSDSTTAVRMYGVFAVEVTSTGVGSIIIERSEDNSTNWVTCKTITHASATESRKFMYENMGDEGGRGGGAWYKATISALTSGSFRVRLVK